MLTGPLRRRVSALVHARGARPARSGPLAAAAKALTYSHYPASGKRSSSAEENSTALHSWQIFRHHSQSAPGSLHQPRCSFHGLPRHRSRRSRSWCKSLSCAGSRAWRRSCGVDPSAGALASASRARPRARRAVLAPGRGEVCGHIECDFGGALFSFCFLFFSLFPESCSTVLKS